MAKKTGKRASKNSSKKFPRSREKKELDEIVGSLQDLRALEKRLDDSMEHKLFELKAVAYVSLFLSAVLVALVLGILLRAIGV